MMKYVAFVNYTTSFVLMFTSGTIPHQRQFYCMEGVFLNYLAEDTDEKIYFRKKCL